ncbi:MAG: carboxypeptidase regulatory-like domain-containing protein, partial [Candidatus Bipolaricaulaceae bacterium]
SSLVYATFLGGSRWDDGFGIAVDGAGHAYVTGWTGSADFPTTPGAYQRTLKRSDTFVVKLHPMGSSLVYATFLGGSRWDDGFGIAVDGAGYAYVAGWTTSADFPTTSGAYQSTLKGWSDAFVVKLHPTGSSLVAATLLGGSEVERGVAIAVGRAGHVYLTGWTRSENFPTSPGAYDTTFNGEDDIFLVRLDPQLSSLVYSTFLGHHGRDAGQGLAVDQTENVYVTGVTGTPISLGIQNPVPGFGRTDAFVAKFDFGAPQLGSLKGRVTDKATGKGIAGATVSTEGGVTTTDQNGYYTLNLPAGTYTASASAQGYKTATQSGIRIEANRTTTVNFALEPLPVITFEPYPFDLSAGVSVMEGGVRYVYYRLKDGTGNPVPHAEVRLKWGEVLYSSAAGEIDIPLRAERFGAKGTYIVEPVEEVRVDGQACQVKDAPRVTLTVKPREWERHWEWGARISTSAGLVAYVKTGTKVGLDFGLSESGAILFGRNFDAEGGAGIHVGASFGLGGNLGVQAGAKAELLFLFTDEDEYLFPRGTTDVKEKKALGALLIYTLAKAAGTFVNPIVGALLEGLLIHSDEYEKYLKEQSKGLGMKAEASRGLGVPVCWSGKDHKACVTLGIKAGFSFTAELVYTYYPKEKEFGLQLRMSSDSQVNVGPLVSNFRAKLAAFEVRYVRNPSPVVTAVVLLLSDDQWEIRLRVNRGDVNKNGQDDVQEVLNGVNWLNVFSEHLTSGRAQDRIAPDGLLDAGLKFLEHLSSVGGEYEILNKSFRKEMKFGLEIKLALGIKVGLGKELTFEETKEWVQERGVFRQGKVYCFEQYTEDQYLADDGRGFGEIVNAVTSGLWEFVKDVVSYTLHQIKAGTDWVVTTSVKTAEGVVVGTMTMVSKAGAVVADTMVTIFTWMGRQIGALPQGRLVWLAEPRTLNAPLPWEGLLVVGGFYKCEPEGLELQVPATLTLTYTEAALPPGVDPKKLDIYMWDPQKGWVGLRASVDTANRTLTAQIRRLGLFAIGLDLSPQPPTNLTAHVSETSVFLSWESRGEADLKGFRVYRANRSGGPYQSLTPEPIDSAYYLDVQVLPGQTYYYVVTAVDAAGNESSFSQEVAVTVERVVFRTDFDSLLGWQATGLWHLANTACANCDRLQGSFARYAQPNACTYEMLDKRSKPMRSQGRLTSPVIDVPQNTRLTIQFDFFREVENNPRSTLDRTYVQIRLGRQQKNRIAWSKWTTIWSRSSKDKSPECASFPGYTFDTGRYTYLQIQFVFDSVNAQNNRFAGWAVDNLVVKPATTSSLALLDVADLGEGWDLPDEAELGELRVVNTPNPVRDVHTTKFVVLGVEAEALRVEVYDLTGRLVWKGEAEGNELPWHTEDLTGLPLANGVYLYIAYVKVEGEWIRLELQKLVILR